MNEEYNIVDKFIKTERYLQSNRTSRKFTIYRNNYSDLAKEIGDNGFNFISKYFNRYNSRHIIISSRNFEDISKLTGKNYKLLASIEPINNMISINEFFGSINSKLEDGGIFICRFKDQEKVEEKILNSSPFPVNLIRYTIYFIYRRVFPKLSITRKLYFFLTKGKNRSLRRLEIIGRLFASGYELESEYKCGDYTYLLAKKRKMPVFDKYSSYGLLFKMRRIGKGGKEIFVYKLRTMVPFSEYLQDYFIKKNSLAKGGKICNDIRVTPLGKILRKFWIDEIPNFINLLKGEMKLVGVRPISKQYLSLYDEELRNLRKLVRPGIIPPFYADMPETIDEIQQSEKRYIKEYLKKPLSTDLRYLYIAIKNITTKRVLSK